jgi:hypothetical protein
VFIYTIIGGAVGGWVVLISVVVGVGGLDDPDFRGEEET